MRASLVLPLLAALVLLPAVLVCLYYLFLAAVACRAKPKRGRQTGRTRTRFAILIPAHDEEDQLAATLASCADLDYPVGRYGVYVVADNCTDRTAEVAKAGGAVCLERHDLQRRGKGPALAWALEQILPERPDAVLILDADCRLDRHALRTFSAQLQAGHPVLQASYVAENPDQSIVSYVGGVANLIENDLFYAPKAHLGWSVLLRGTGMVFRRDVLEDCPWDADSVVEDVEYTVRLYESGIPVQFVPSVRVWSAFPEQAEQMHVQRTRWVGGNFRLGLRHSPRLLLSGRWELVDLGWTLLAAVRSLVVLYVLLAALLALGVAALHPGWIGAGLGGTALALLGAFCFYFGLGVVRLGLNARRLQLLLHTPRTILRLLQTASGSLWPGRTRAWERTPR